jgi:hypothetical protein
MDEDGGVIWFAGVLGCGWLKCYIFATKTKDTEKIWPRVQRDADCKECSHENQDLSGHRKMESGFFQFLFCRTRNLSKIQQGEDLSERTRIHGYERANGKCVFASAFLKCQTIGGLTKKNV